MAVLYIFVAAITFVFSLLTVLALLTSDSEVLSDGGARLPFTQMESFPFRGVISWYLAIQIGGGFIYGPLAFLAGWFSLKGKARGYVLTVSWISLLNFPLGTTVGILALVGLGRPSVKQAFRR